ncbi:methylase [Pilimelia anulata]|uniref:peptide chain release factor N(5)-glutamine methyltransferase n=1 Tax=Pilimelia anulata TaxID=53371 RepID=A0A8J3FEK5_9ACTN|nr:putative protein N(5)-glutamine methyltransferase [Pilimelia anulata]GGK08786.1 methylase [Pilimelia anulata]
MYSPDLPALTRTLRAAGCVFAEDEARLLADRARTAAELADLVRRRAAGRPLEHLLGWAEFCGLRVAVDPGVFVPRRRTGLLAARALAAAAPGAVVVDLCCGSGAIGAVLLAAGTGLEVHAADIDAAAVACARRNLAPHGRVWHGDLYAPLPPALRGRVGVLVANAPYVPSADLPLLPPEARLHEPRTALDGGADGLAVQRRVVADAGDWLAPGGHLLIETSAGRAPATAALVAAAGLAARVVADPDLDATAVVGVRVSGGRDRMRP